MFNSVSSLRKAIEQTAGIPADKQKKVRLTGAVMSSFTPVDYMLVNSDDESQVLGNYTVTYEGTQPGRGKVWSVYGTLA